MTSSLTAILLVFCLLGALLFWARRTAGGAKIGLSLRVVDAVNLGSGRAVTVVRSGERYFLLGTTAHCISLIAELAPGDLAASKQTATRPLSLPRLPEGVARVRSLRNAP
jgi:flagellar biogenesis protein FliO